MWPGHGCVQKQTFEFYFCGTLWWQLSTKAGFGAAIPNCGDSYGNTDPHAPTPLSQAVTTLSVVADFFSKHRKIIRSCERLYLSIHCVFCVTKARLAEGTVGGAQH